MIKIGIKNKNLFTLKAVIGKKANSFVIKKEGFITDDVSKKNSYVYFKKEILEKNLKTFASELAKKGRDYQVDITSFVSKKLDETKVITIFVDKYIFINGKGIYNAKTKKPDKLKDITLIGVSVVGKAAAKKAKLYAEVVNWTRNLQITPPNLLHSEKLASIYKKDLGVYKNLSIKVLNKKQIQEMKMGLLLSVNSASYYEARVVIVEYLGNPKSKEKTTFVGKGITFDAGGMNLKPGKHMLGMKYDMSGSAVAMGTMKAIAELKPKANVSAIVALTDNVISALASKPDSVYTSMSGKTVEVNNTDAEGRLVLADAITYAVRKMKSTRIVDIATLTGAVVLALGLTFTGVWSTTDKGWNDLNEAAKRANELVWRMPLHSDYFKFMKTSKIADMFNTDYTGYGGASSAAMFLTQFSENVEHIHLDIAGTATAGNKGEGMGPMVKTLVELTNK